MDWMHEYSRSVVIRLRYRINSAGGKTSWFAIDSDLPERDALLGVLLRAQSMVLLANDNQHDSIDMSDIDEQLGVVDIDATDDEQEECR